MYDLQWGYPASPAYSALHAVSFSSGSNIPRRASPRDFSHDFCVSGAPACQSQPEQWADAAAGRCRIITKRALALALLPPGMSEGKKCRATLRALTHYRSNSARSKHTTHRKAS
eukprot:s332_g19.t1